MYACLWSGCKRRRKTMAILMAWWLSIIRKGARRKPPTIWIYSAHPGGVHVHPNVGAVLAVDYGAEAVTNALLADFMRKQGYPLSQVRHRFFTIADGFTQALQAGERILRDWLTPVNQVLRTSQPLSHLKLALQCGGLRCVFGDFRQSVGRLDRQGGAAQRRQRQSGRNR